MFFVTSIQPSRPAISRSARDAVAGRVDVFEVVNRLPTLRFDGAVVQNGELVEP
jgi:hypothetical protein